MSPSLQELRDRLAGGTIHVVPYCHPDYSWTHHRAWHEERYAVSTAEALDLMREHPDFRWCLEPWIDHVQPFLERCPDRVEELRARLRSGQMGVLAPTLTSPRPATCADETFLRNMILGREEYRAFCPEADLSVMACPDVGLGHSQMPQLCRLGGFRLYTSQRSEAAQNRKGTPRYSHWRGLDGSEILFRRGDYGGLYDAARFAGDWRARWDELVEQYLSHDFRSAWLLAEGKTFWAAHGMDDSRPLRDWHDDPLPLFELLAEWNRREDSRLVWATPNEVARALEQETLPTIEGPLDPVDVAYNSGWLGARGLWRLRQELDTAMLLLERSCALVAAAGGAPPASLDDQRRLWWETIRLASHAQQWAFERDWQWLRLQGLRHCQEMGERTAAALQTLAAAGRSSDEAGRPLVLFNPLPYDREEWVEFPWVQPRMERGEASLLDETGAEVPCQIGEPVGSVRAERLAEAPLYFRARVPALGVAVYRLGDRPLQDRPPAPEGDSLPLGPLTVRFTGRGLQELADARTGLCWTAPPGSAIGDVRLCEVGPGPLHVGPVTSELSGAAGQGRWTLTGPHCWQYHWETTFHGHEVRQEITLAADRPALDFRTEVFCAGAEGFFALCFDLPLTGPAHADVPFGVEPRNLTGEPWAEEMPPSYYNIERTRRNQIWARSFVSVSDGERGVSLITADGDRYWLWDEAAGRLRHLLFTPAREQRSDWEAWINRDRLALGWHEFRHRLLLHPGDWRAAGLCAESDRLRLPLQVVEPLGAPPPPLPRPVAPLRLEPHSVRLSAFYQTPRGYVLRCHESAGEETEVRLTLPFAPARATRVDLNLEPWPAPAPQVQGRELAFALRPWEIATLLLEP